MVLPLNLQASQQLTFTPVYLFLCFLLFSASLFVLIRSFNNGADKKTTSNNRPPSPPAVAIIGNLHQLGKLPHRSLQALSAKYGPVMLLRLGQVPTLVISSADMAREVMKTHDIIFSNRSRPTAVHFFLNGFIDVAFAPYGEYWRQTRKICVVELLSVLRVQSFQYVRKEEVDILVNKLRVLSGNRSSVNLSQLLLEVTNNIIARCVLGRKCEGEGGKIGFGEFFGDWFPCLGWIDVITGLTSRLKHTFREMDDYFNMVIEEHKLSKNDDETSTNQVIDKKEDFVDILLRVQKDGVLEFNFTIDDIKAILVDMIVGGTDTTFTTMEWVMAELLKHPSKMQKVQEEVRRVVGNKTEIEVEDINKMDYLKCVIKETLRLYPPIAFLLPRETFASAELCSFHIPPKTRVLVNAWAIQRDPKFWDNPHEFVPERFIHSSVDFKGQDFQFIPFGAGRRGCPGTAFGVAAVENVIANLIHWFDWELLHGTTFEDLDMHEVYGLTINKKVALTHVIPVLSPSS
ncbi:hypothetical protein K2173_023302 [Erythroxylum novogranatense]|uniref:Cytochrome P450 n=1 Tax=Erythroxylum novogranatense TaxID=1862640 RepID=A0AAV8T8W7_9ROSI|nr:hypothetical protein K2173_023302 [Erythroxylum novogranatense]